MKGKIEFEFDECLEREFAEGYMEVIGKMLHMFHFVDSVCETKVVDDEPKRDKYDIHFNEKFCVQVEAKNEDEAYELAKAKKGNILFYETEFVHADRGE